MAYITDEPYRGAIGDLRMLQQPGLDTFRQFVHGELPAPPIWRLTGFRPRCIVDGHFEATLPSSPWFSNGSFSIYGGLLAWAADFTMATGSALVIQGGARLLSEGRIPEEILANATAGKPSPG